MSKPSPPAPPTPLDAELEREWSARRVADKLAQVWDRMEGLANSEDEGVAVKAVAHQAQMLKYVADRRWPVASQVDVTVAAVPQFIPLPAPKEALLEALLLEATGKAGERVALAPEKEAMLERLLLEASGKAEEEQ